MHFTNTGNPLLIYNIYSFLQLYISRLNKNIKSEKIKKHIYRLISINILINLIVHLKNNYEIKICNHCDYYF